MSGSSEICYPGSSEDLLISAARGRCSLAAGSLKVRRRPTGCVVKPIDLDGASPMSYGWRLLLLVGVCVVVARGPRVAVWAEEKSAPPRSDAAAAASEAPAAEKYKLAYKFQPNQVAHYEVSQETEIITHVKEETETARNSSKA